MIGVAARQAQLPQVREFFELFKTPWELATPGTRYEVLLCADDQADSFTSEVAVVYGGRALPIDHRLANATQELEGPIDVQWDTETLPIYGSALSFSEPTRTGYLAAGTAAIDYQRQLETTSVYRFGYDLFGEVDRLLTHGQPKSHAGIPTLELHIELLRRCLSRAGVSYIEIPARPHNTSFVCCLTHDIDFFGIRRHGADRTLAGFLARGTWGTLVDLIHGVRPLDEALGNWLAVLSLPFVWIGLARDFWHPFEDYARADQNRSSTFFLIPFKGSPGANPDGRVDVRRAAPYGIHEIRDDIDARSSPGTEFGVHGIDAWRSADAGRTELGELTAATGQHATGIRMHWLYFTERSPREIEAAGFTYDSTWGYNDAVGYKAGTSQVFKLPGTERLLELPLTIMDSALFYPDRMGLTRRDAMPLLRQLVEHAVRFGGAVVINWHDRSLAPERQWGACYRSLLEDLSACTPWFATAGRAVDWFRWRRSIRFMVDDSTRSVRVEASSPPAGLPPASVLMRRSDAPTTDTSFAGGAQAFCL